MYEPMFATKIFDFARIGMDWLDMKWTELNGVKLTYFTWKTHFMQNSEVLRDIVQAHNFSPNAMFSKYYR